GISFTDEKLTDVAVTQSRAVIMNANYEVIDEIDYLATGEGITEYHSIESHDFVMLGLNHYLICGYVGANVTNIPTEVDDDGSAYVTACIVQEVIDGELIFQWDSTDFPELYGYSTECNDYDADTPQDYAHLNSVDIDPVDGNIIMSFRQLDALLKVDRETGDIIWILGGIGDQFGLTDEQLFSHQHHAKFSDDGILTFYDNGNAYEQTRVVQVILDEENMTISEYIAYGTERKYTWYMGSAMCLDQDAGLYLMGWGGRTEDGAIFSEINYVTGETLFELYDMDTGYENSSYRVYKFDS
ncbi:MAG: aryl-sulfate sulfotransferase, partial [Eubacteriales bacterium]